MYDYKEGKRRLQEIINNNLKIEDSKDIPTDENFTYENAYYGWVSAIFVDIRNSTQLFTNTNQEAVSKVICCFSSEIIEILRTSNEIREIGIRGDCVYAIYNTPLKENIQDVLDQAITVNTFLTMLNQMLRNKSLPTIKAGIGAASAQELVVKAGRKGVGINNAVWIGKAVTYASALSSQANKGNIRPIAVSDLMFKNLIDGTIRNYFLSATCIPVGNFYHAEIFDNKFQEWIQGGMR